MSTSSTTVPTYSHPMAYVSMAYHHCVETRWARGSPCLARTASLRQSQTAIVLRSARNNALSSMGFNARCMCSINITGLIFSTDELCKMVEAKIASVRSSYRCIQSFGAKPVGLLGSSIACSVWGFSATVASHLSFRAAIPKEGLRYEFRRGAG